MMDLLTAAKQALEALEQFKGDHWYEEIAGESATNLRTAIEQAEKVEESWKVLP